MNDTLSRLNAPDNTVKCYFCQQPLAPFRYDNLSGHCPFCKDKYNLNYVNCYYSYSNFLQPYELEISSISINFNYRDKLHCAGLDFSKNQTQIMVSTGLGGWKTVLTLLGCTLTPANIRHKLQQYFLFS